MKGMFLLLSLSVFLCFSHTAIALESPLEIQAAKYLSEKGIIAGVKSDSEYRTSGTITRKEVSKIIAKLAGVTPAEKCEGKFQDVSNDWGCKYIEWMLSAGYISANAKFRPNDNITKSEAVKLIFKARNIEKKYSTSNWQQDYAKTAAELGLVETYSDYGSSALRGWIFRLAARGFDEYKKQEVLMSDEAL